MDPSLVVLGAAVLAGLAVSVATRRPSLFLVGLGAGGLFWFYEKEKREYLHAPQQHGTFAEQGPIQNDYGHLGAGSNGNANYQHGPARFYGPHESAVADPALYPVPRAVKERRFWEDPMRDGMRWAVSGPEGPYTGWRGANGVW
jgi:hypothetical protein